MSSETAQELADRYAAQGYLSPLSVSSPEEASAYRAEFDRLEAEIGKERAVTGILDYHFTHRFIWEIATHPKILDAVEAIYGENILLLATHFFCKFGPDDRFVAWHQDVTYWGLEPATALTAWYAIDDSDTQNGCMRVIPGSHLHGVLEHGKSDAAGNLLSVNQEAKVTEADEANAQDLVLRAGEVSLHDGRLLHGSLPNRSPRRRCGLTLRYVPASVRPLNSGLGGRWKAIVVRGSQEASLFPPQKPPFDVD